MTDESRADRFESGPGLMITKQDGRTVKLPLPPRAPSTSVDDRSDRFGTSSAKGLRITKKAALDPYRNVLNTGA